MKNRLMLTVFFAIILNVGMTQTIITTVIDDLIHLRRVEFRFDQFDDYGLILVSEGSLSRAKLFDEFRVYYRGEDVDIIELNEASLTISKIAKSPDGESVYLRGYKVEFSRSLIKNNIEKVSIYYDGELEAAVTTIGLRK